ncbi:hypothetical protein Stube_67600 [Streptomyces tubercidicus]|uniref:Uncharacterized protein n=1 Tax=Streptomyces tubercidicus TaxID=47759 RepID=A0A640V319_9ACTN|nr:hypothetical protein Stube_67600 [Streptomyces tubercidicus]
MRFRFTKAVRAVKVRKARPAAPVARLLGLAECGQPSPPPGGAWCTPMGEFPSPGLRNSYARQVQSTGRAMFHVKHRKAIGPAVQVALSRSACSTIASSRAWCAPRQ